VKQTALYHKNEPELRPYPELEYSRHSGYSGKGEWSARRRIVFMICAALASWAVLGLIGYGIYCLFS